MASADFSDTCSTIAKHDADQHVARSNSGDRESPLTGRGDHKVAGTRPGVHFQVFTRARWWRVICSLKTINDQSD
jgi:hypothetical protein